MKRILCFFGKHELKDIARLSECSHMLGCIRCHSIFAYNSDVDLLLPWSMQLGDMYTRWEPKNYKKALKAYDKWNLNL